MDEYNHIFYQNRNQETYHSAKTILSIIFELIPQIQSVLDVGCGVGTWLKVSKELGASSCFGYEGEWFDKKNLVVEEEFVSLVNFEKLQINKTVDLLINLEVAEHLNEKCAEAFIGELVKASSYILFSAAIKGQGGNHHYNEQWQSYWMSLFEKFGFVAIDCIRPKIWEDKNIPFWYKQNIFFYVKKGDVAKLNFINPSAASIPNIVHPELFEKTLKRNELGVKGSFCLFLATLKKFILKRIKRK